MGAPLDAADKDFFMKIRAALRKIARLYSKKEATVKAFVAVGTQN
jgi:hypothetical protein